jgi:hypothetical protein
MIPLKEIKAVYELSSAAGGQLQSQYGTKKRPILQ